MDPTVLSKSYLSQDLLDPGIKDIKIGSTGTFADFGIGRYVYAVYAKPAPAASWNGLGTATPGLTATAFNIATTILDDQKGPITKISGDYDERYGNCSAATCPVSLIGPGGATTNLKDKDTANIPYPINGF